MDRYAAPGTCGNGPRAIPAPAPILLTPRQPRLPDEDGRAEIRRHTNAYIFQSFAIRPERLGSITTHPEYE